MGKRTFQIHNRYKWDKVLYEHTCEGNTLQKTVEAAIENGADLDQACFYGLDLSGADLSMGSFEEADFGRTCLMSANLSGARLIRASFRNAYLVGANFHNADILGVDFMDAKWVADKPETTEETIRKSRYLRTQFAPGKFP
jgi:uncharacterized protein YjbI with pentapeptide repeats